MVFSSPDEPHAAVVLELIDLLTAAQRAGYGRARTAPRTVAFDYAEQGLQAQGVTHADLFFVRGESMILRPGDTLSCPLFPGVTRPVAQIFAGIL